MLRIIFGISTLAELVYVGLQRQGVPIDAFCLNKAYTNAQCKYKFNIPVIAYEDLKKKLPNQEIGIYICVGYKNMNESRAKLFDIISKDYKILSYRDPSAKVLTELMGEGNIFFEDTYVGPFTQIGNGNIFYPKSIIAHHSNIGDFNYFAICASVAGFVRIGNKCFFGNNCCTKDNIEIIDSVLIGAGCYVGKNVLNTGSVMVPERSVILKNHSSKDFL